MTRSPQPTRAAVVRAARRLNETGLSLGTSGNVSGRDSDGFLITPSARPYARMTDAEVVGMTLDGEVRGDAPRPSTEWPFHAAIYRDRPEVGGVVHAHSLHATALSCARREIPPFHYMVAIAGGRSIRCAGYAKPGSEDLAALAVEALAGRSACLLSNHGVITLGKTVDEAFELAVEVENLAHQYCLTLQIGPPALLTDEEMEVVLRQFETYRNHEA